MPIADLILSQITAAGYSIDVQSPEPFSNDLYHLRATHVASGRFLTVNGTTLIDAAANLARHLELDLLTPAALPPPQAPERPRATTTHQPSDLFVILSLVALILILDILSPGINLGIFYLAPLAVAYRRHASLRRMALLTLLMGILIFADRFVSMNLSRHAPFVEPAGLLNRSFALFALTACSAVLMVRRAWRAGNSQAPSAPNVKPRRPWIAWVAVGCVAATFIGDLISPVAANLSIFYLIAVALVAITFRRALLWTFVALLPCLVVAAFFLCPRGNITPDDSPLILVNRVITCVGLALVAFSCQQGKAAPVHFAP